MGIGMQNNTKGDLDGGKGNDRWMGESMPRKQAWR